MPHSSEHTLENPSFSSASSALAASAPSTTLSFTRRELVVVLLLSFVGAMLRFGNLLWDEGLSYHPDEMNIAIAVSKLSFANWTLKPDFFSYNGLPLYLYRALAEFLSWLTNKPAWIFDIGHITLIGRYVSATLSTLSLPLLFLLGRLLTNRRAALFALFLATFCGGLIQTAHYAVTENILYFCILLLSVFSARAVSSETAPGWSWALIGISGGIALGAKTTALAFGVFPLVVFWARILRGDGWKALGGVLLCSWLWLTTAFALSPWSLLELPTFLHVMHYEGGIVRGTVDIPYTLQFIGTTPWLFSFSNLRWHLGPVLPWLALGGIVGWMFFQMKKPREEQNALPLLFFSCIFFLVVGSWHAKFIRNQVPIYPALLLASGWALDALCHLAAGHRKAIRIFATLFAVGTLALSALWGISTAYIFFSDSTRHVATRWIDQHIPPGSTLLIETWDYKLPAALPGVNPKAFEYLLISPPERDSEEKRHDLAQKLASADFIILASGRNWKNLPRLPKRFPLMTAYYGSLFSGSLGFRETASFYKYPGIPPFALPGFPALRFPGFEIDDSAAEETFSVFDHPTIRIFRKEKTLDAATIETLLKERMP